MKKKILFIITRSHIGGAQKWVKEQIEILQNDFELYLATDEEGWLVQNSKVKKYFIDPAIKKRFSIPYLLKLLKFLKNNQIDIVVASSANAGIYSRLSKLFYSIKVIYVGHGWSSIYNGGKLKWLYTKIEKYLSLLTDSILCVSQSDFERAIHEIGISPNKLQLIKNKIFPMKEKSQFSNAPVRILSVARLQHPKRIDLLIKAIKRIDSDIELYIIGSGPLRKYLEELKNDKVFFLGNIHGFNEYYRYDIFALISESEGMPLSAIEAMSAGLPLVLSNVGGCPELILNNGILVDNNIDSIANGIKKAIDMKEKFSANSKKLFQQNFDLSKYKYQYRDYYHNIIDKS